MPLVDGDRSGPTGCGGDGGPGRRGGVHRGRVDPEDAG